MTALAWDQTGERLYEAGADRAVLYPPSGPGVVWNGLVSVEEQVADSDPESYYYDGVKYCDWVLGEDYQATLTAFSAPKEFAACNGKANPQAGLYITRQPRTTFGLSYRSKIGNDSDGIDHGYKLHIVWNATASPDAPVHKTVDESSDLDPKVWTINAVPPPADTYKPTAHFIVDSTEMASDILDAIEDILYGRGGEDPRLPDQDEVISLIDHLITEFIEEFI